jgi:methylase of polypeptide subunit release factors
LGSGVGMLGISLLKTIPMAEYYFTDCHPKVLNFLKHNIQINFPGPEDLGIEKVGLWLVQLGEGT